MSVSAETRVGRSAGIREWATVAAFAALLAMNVLANVLPLAGRRTGEISERFPVSLTPADYAFSIWSVIYLSLAAFVVYQILPGQRSTRLDRIRLLFVLSCAFNVAWLVAWHNLFIVSSLAPMFGLLVVLALSYRELDRVVAWPGGTEVWLLRFPFSLYLGWVCVATLVNLGALLYHLGPLRDDLLDLRWTLLALALLTALTLWILWRSRDIIFAAVSVWAFTAVAVANRSVPDLLWAAGSAALIVLAGIVLSLASRGSDRAGPPAARQGRN